jgi:patatin-related protein
MSDASLPKVDYTKEVRFAVVMYGGVSLAIYINGIAQELLRWVRSTAKHATEDVALLPIPSTEKASSESGLPWSPTERVYRKLGYILEERSQGHGANAKERLRQADQKLAENKTIHTRFVVDILSGTSAGGINGIFLAKALANGQDLSGIEKLWIEEGDIKTLINDKKSVEKPLSLQNPPSSLLNSQRMYLELLKAFDSMEKSASAPYVDELDLFVTTTDLSGVTLPIRLSDGVVYERRHRNVLRFVYSKKEVSGEDDRNDFEATYNPFLAYAARCTSAFPVAFEPMCLCDADKILERYGSYAADQSCRSESKEWQRFYKDYLNPAGVLTVKFPKRAFADGGYLDNKPFTYATETLARRQANLLVTRKLIYIEPSPEHPEDVAETEGKPDAIENVGAALLSLPRYETIREDLQRLRDHNRLVERVSSILESVDLDMGQAGFERKPQLSDADWGKLDLAEVVNAKGPGYVAYHRLEIASVTDDLARLVTRVAGFDEESDYFLIIRSLVREWRRRNYVEYGKGSPSLNTFLFEFNLAYPMRRINFLRTKITELSGSDNYRDDAGAQAELLTIKTELNRQYKNLRHIARLLRSRQVPAEPGAPESYSSPPSPAYGAIKNLKIAIAQQTLKQLPEAARRKLEEAVQRKQRDRAESVLEYFLGNRLNGGAGISGNRIEEECNNRAKTFLENNAAIAALFKDISDTLKLHIGLAKETADVNCRAALGVTDRDFEGSASKPPDSKKDIRDLGYYYKYYDEYDRIIFPIVYGTEIGEAAKVDIIRISPEDAKALINERETGCYKLAGTALGHFGAFLDPLWRKNDILWGRLDGAERIITALLPDEPELARLLVGEAHAAIVHEAIARLGEKQARELLCESAMRTKSGNPDSGLLGQFIDNLKAHDPAGLLNNLIDDKALQQHYTETFDVRSRLDPESSVKTAARATTVIGKMLSELSEKRTGRSDFVAWIARFGQIFSSLVEVSVPRSLPNLLFRHWLKMLYLFEVLLIVGATLLAKPAVAQLGWTLLGITVSANVISWWLNDFMQRKRTVFRFLLLLLGAGFTLLALIGALKIAWLLFGLTVEGLPPLAWISHNLQQLSGWFESKLPKAVWGFVQRFLPLLAALLGVGILWRLGGRGGHRPEPS